MRKDFTFALFNIVITDTVITYYDKKGNVRSLPGKWKNSIDKDGKLVLNNTDTEGNSMTMVAAPESDNLYLFIFLARGYNIFKE